MGQIIGLRADVYFKNIIKIKMNGRLGRRYLIKTTTSNTSTASVKSS